jgi:hypothetical protein
MAKQREASYEYLCSELDYIVSENHPVIKGKQSMLGVGKGAWLALACGVNNPKNYSSLSVILTEPYSPNLIPLADTIPSKSKLLRNLNENLSILVDGDNKGLSELDNTISTILNQKRGCNHYSINYMDR